MKLGTRCVFRCLRAVERSRYIAIFQAPASRFPFQIHRRQIASNHAPIVPRRLVHSPKPAFTAHRLSTARALAPTIETDGGRNGYRIFGNNKLHATMLRSCECTRACVLRNYECPLVVCVQCKIWPRSDVQTKERKYSSRRTV